jgi:hypothetical protein
MSTLDVVAQAPERRSVHVNSSVRRMAMPHTLRLNWRMVLWLAGLVLLARRPCPAQILVATVTHNANLRFVC